jgi:membrane protease YdiL (CAAX protease family)/tetratricopeptide (TPR) repeat protein
MKFKKRIVIESFALLLVLAFLMHSRRNLPEANLDNPSAQTAQNYHILSKSFIAQGRYIEAEDSALSALTIDPKFAKAYADLGSIYSKTANFIKAKKFYQRALEHTGDDRLNSEFIHYNLGEVCEREKQIDQSWQYYRKSFQMKSILGVHLWKNQPRSAAYYVTKDDKKGFTDYIKKGEDLPKEVSQATAKLKFDLLLHRYSKVAQDCRQYLNDNPDSRYSYLFLEHLAAALGGMKEYVPADNILTKLESLELSLEDKNWIRQMRVYNFFSQKRYEEAVKYLNSTSIYGNKENLEQEFYWKAIIHKARNDLIEEKFALRQLLRNFPESNIARWAHMQLSATYAKLGDYINTYKEVRKSRILGLMIILECAGATAASALFIAFLALIFRVFFRKKAIENKSSRQFKKLGLFVFFIFFLIVPWFMYLIFLCLNYYFSGVFKFLRLNPVLVANTFSQCFLALVCLFLLKRKYKLDNASLGFISRGYKYNFLLPLVVTVMSIFVLSVFIKLVSLSGIKPPPPSQLKYLVHNILKQHSTVHLVFLFITASIIVPLAEEIIFRVYLLNFFKKHSNTLCAVIFSTLLFALSHETLLFAPYFIFIGVILSMIYLKTKSIIPCIVTHGLYNFLVIFFGVAKVIFKY